ncbi:MAG: multiubiquitin domain-containing protein [Clostridia bacterium]|nr:multiubiquitin domain-containing protein [Clostridia bacterium]
MSVVPSYHFSKKRSDIMTEEKKKKKTVTIIINGRDFEVEKVKITFEKIVELGLGNYDSNPSIAYTVSYSKGEDKKPKGQLVAGESVMVKEGMIFNATRTDKS